MPENIDLTVARKVHALEAAVRTLSTAFARLPDGWAIEKLTWVYVSASSFKIVGSDETARFPVGTRLRCVQGTSTLYFYVTGSSFSTDTTITMSGGDIYTLTNTTISAAAYSSWAYPHGFPKALVDAENGLSLGNLIGAYLTLPGLVGFWPVSSRRDTAVSDISGKSLTLTSTGGPSYGVLRDALPYVTFDGATQYLSRADEAALSITGALTIGAWVKFITFPAPAVAPKIFCKHNNTAVQKGYGLDVSVEAGPVYHPRAFMSGTLNTSTLAAASYSISAGTWHFMAGRFIPSTEVTLYDNGIKTVNTTSIPASEVDNTAPLVAGANAELNLFSNASEALLFLCEAALTDAMLARLYNMGRVFFGV